MDRKDEELRETIRKLWPITGKKNIIYLVPPNEGKAKSKMAALGFWPLEIRNVEKGMRGLSRCANVEPTSVAMI